ncbi:MAG: glycosyltransferase family 39 protein [Deltaproteobacteria bacterium]|nr:glycosyltransferase family 39 protein [Deltaproteobacteria bacterium]
MARKKRRQSIDNIKASTGIASFADQYAHLFVSAFLFLALILRIVALVDLKGSVYFYFLLWDERIYHEWARRIADGTFTSTSVYEFPSLPAYITALIYKLLSPDAFYVRVMNIILGVLTCWLIYLIGKELVNRTIGLASCLIACLYKPLFSTVSSR